MIPALWTAKTGLSAQQTQLDNIANNLANANTTGYKKGRVNFEDLAYQTFRQPGAPSSQQTNIPTGLQIGTGTKVGSTAKQHTQGSLQQTNNPLDIAISGPGFFQITMPDGTSAYTRDGSFNMDSNGQIVTTQGYPVQPGITVPQGASNISIAKDGTISATLPGNTTPQQLGTIQIHTFVNQAGLQANGENLLQETTASGTAQASTPGTNGAGTLSQSYLESSNVNLAEELVALIQAQRAYEINTKVIQAADQMLGKLAQL